MPPKACHWHFIGKEICQFRAPDLGFGGNEKPLRPANVSPVASYSWVDTPQPTIIVPGSPRVFNEPSVPFTVPPDTREDHYGQAHTHSIPFNLLEPLVASVQQMHPEFPFHTLHLVSDRALLRSLLRWVHGASTATDFRYDIQVAGKTMLCTRQILREWHFSGGYGKNFERAVTSEPSLPAPIVEHARVIRYTLAGLELLIRYQVDACLPEKQDSSTGDREDIVPTVSELSPATVVPMDGGRRVTVVAQPGAPLVAQARVVELKTSAWKQRNSGAFWGAAYPQMLFSQTPHLVVGLREGGTFCEVQKHALARGRCDGTAPKAEKELNALAAVLRDVYKTVLAQGDGALLSLVCLGGVLKLYRRCAWDADPDALPDSMVELFRPPQSAGGEDSRAGVGERGIRISAML